MKCMLESHLLKGSTMAANDPKRPFRYGQRASQLVLCNLHFDGSYTAKLYLILWNFSWPRAGWRAI